MKRCPERWKDGGVDVPDNPRAQCVLSDGHSGLHSLGIDPKDFYASEVEA